MHADFWKERWERHEIGFHLSEVNPCLLRHWASLALAEDAGVLVPLCGKTLDMAWLAARGHAVTGIELSERAVQEFFADNDLPFVKSAAGMLQRYAEEGICLLQGDFFAVEPQQVAGCRVFYDRAALIALPDAMRVAYVQQLERLLPADAEGLLVTLDYPQEQMDGPPFAVGDAQVQALYGAHWDIRLLEVQDILPANPRFIERGLSRLHERVYHLRRKG